MTQPSFSFRPTIDVRFAEFDKKHPEVYEYLVSLCYDLIGRGIRHYGIRPLWERLRWHFQIEKEMGADFKLNDNFPSRYARKIMNEHPDLGDFFETRELRS